MRGRTLDQRYATILDEAQNATDLQPKMFLTRIGANAKAIITGDLTQIDLHPKSEERPGQSPAAILQNIDGIAHIELDEEDVVRHPAGQGDHQRNLRGKGNRQTGRARELERRTPSGRPQEERNKIPYLYAHDPKILSSGYVFAGGL